MKKRLLAAFLCIVLALSCIACGNTDTDETTKAPAGTEQNDNKETDAPSAPKETVTIKFLSGEAGKQPAYQKAVDAWNEGQGKDKGIFIDYEVNSDYQKVIEAGVANGQLPDICKPTNNQVIQYVGTGDIVSLEEFEGWEELVAEINSPAIEQRTTFDGKWYGLFITTQSGSMVINVDLFKEAGLVNADGSVKVPTTWSELRETAKKLTDTSKQVYGFGYALKSGLSYYLPRPFYSSVIPQGVYTDYKNLTVSANGNGDLFQLMIDMRDDGSMFPAADTLDNDTLRAYFAAGKIAMAPTYSWDTSVYTQQFPVEDEWMVVAAPVKDGMTPYPKYTNYAGMYCLTKTALEHPEEAWAVYEYLHSDEVLKLLAEECGEMLLDAELYSTCTVDEHALQFAALVDPDYDPTIHPSFTIEGDKEVDLYRKAWMGEITAKEAEEKFAAASTAGLKAAVESGKIDISGFIE